MHNSLKLRRRGPLHLSWSTDKHFQSTSSRKGFAQSTEAGGSYSTSDLVRPLIV